jgi:hypothetical protein
MQVKFEKNLPRSGLVQHRFQPDQTPLKRTKSSKKIPSGKKMKFFLAIFCS